MQAAVCAACDSGVQVFNEELMLPVMIPSMADQIEIMLFDDDSVAAAV